MVLWFQHRKYTAEYVTGQLIEITNKMRQETRRMIYVASAATCVMVMIQAAYLYELLGS